MLKKLNQSAESVFDDLFSNFQLSPLERKSGVARLEALLAGNLKDQEGGHVETEDMRKFGEVLHSLPPGTVIQKTAVYYDLPPREVKPSI